jgi:hypothetical protein
MVKTHNSESAAIESPVAERKISGKSAGFPETSWRIGCSSGRTVPLSGTSHISLARGWRLNSFTLLGERDVEACG